MVLRAFVASSEFVPLARVWNRAASGVDVIDELGHGLERATDASGLSLTLELGGVCFGQCRHEHEYLLSDDLVSRRLELGEAIQQDIGMREDADDMPRGRLHELDCGARVQRAGGSLDEDLRPG